MVRPPGPPPACGLLLLGAPVMPVPRPLSRGIVLCPVVAPELSLLRGIWFCAEAIPLDTNNATAANMAEYFLMSSFIFLSSDPQTNAGTGQAFRAIRRARAKFPDAQQLFPCPPFSGGYRRAYRPAAMVKFGARYATSLTFTGTTRLYGETRPGRQPGLAAFPALQTRFVLMPWA